MLTITDNSMFLDGIMNRFQHDLEFQQMVTEEINNSDVCSDMQLANLTDGSCARDVRAIRLCRVRHDLGHNLYTELDYWLCRFNNHYVIAECSVDKRCSTCTRVVKISSPLWKIALAA